MIVTRPHPVTGRLPDTGDGVGAVPVEDVELCVVLALALALALELEPALALELAVLVEFAPEKAPAGSSQGLGEAEGVAVAEGVVVGVEVGVAEGVADAVAVAVAEAVGVADFVQKTGNPPGLLRADCNQLGSAVGNGLKPDGSAKLGNGPGVAVGEPDVVGVAVAVAAVAGQVSASSRFCTCGSPSSVSTVADAWVSCAPGNVAT